MTSNRETLLVSFVDDGKERFARREIVDFDEVNTGVFEVTHSLSRIVSTRYAAAERPVRTLTGGSATASVASDGEWLSVTVADSDARRVRAHVGLGASRCVDACGVAEDERHPHAYRYGHG